MDHPLGMELEAMRRAGYAAVDALAARMPDPEAGPVLRRASPAEMQERLCGAMSGRYDVFIDDRFIRTLGPGEHFGELAARDWGGGYGYARTATVRCAQDGQLLRLSSDDFQWLVQTQPAVRAKLAKILADRLRER